MSKQKRILWLINHTTLRGFEVPLLRSFGYEVYTPKLFPSDEANRSASIDYQYDQSLSIPEHALSSLNNHNFYSKPLPQNIITILNDYFSIAFTAFFPLMMHELIKSFTGNVFIRVFGLSGVLSYTDIINSPAFPHGFINDLNLVKERVWLAQAYPNLAEIESSFLRERAITLPLGLSDDFCKNKDAWEGSDNRILFVCPRIASSPAYYGAIYNQFKEHFGNLPHIIAGAQPAPVNDANVAGFQERHVFDGWLKTCKVMFYHSREPRHLHYHPLEAVTVGMPLIYMRGGMLELLGGDSQPGACDTLEEAKEKLKRILDNDEAFINDVRQAQKVLLHSFTLNHCRKFWENNFLKRCGTETSNIGRDKLKKIAIFLPVAYYGGSLSAAKNMAKMLYAGSRDQNNPVEVVFSCLANAYNIKEDFADLISMGIQVRETTWCSVETSEINMASYLRKTNYDFTYDTHQYPSDGIANFQDCDFWLLISDRTLNPLLATKPYGVVVYDYIQRYIPELFGSFYEGAFLSTVRRARFVLTTTPQTRQDVIQYAGVKPTNTHVLPMEFNPYDFSNQQMSSETPKEKNYFIWATNCAFHKNHLAALDALESYYKLHNGAFTAIITDPSGLFSVKKEKNASLDPYHKKVWEKLEKSEVLMKNIEIVGYLKEQEYLEKMTNAKFIWHPTIIDNGTFSVIEAAYYGVPALSSDYPQMRFINDRFRLNMHFCDANNYTNMAQQLKEMETLYKRMVHTLPDKEYLEQFSYRQLAPSVWRMVRELI